MRRVPDRVKVIAVLALLLGALGIFNTIYAGVHEGFPSFDVYMGFTLNLPTGPYRIDFFAFGLVIGIGLWLGDNIGRIVGVWISLLWIIGAAISTVGSMMWFTGGFINAMTGFRIEAVDVVVLIYAIWQYNVLRSPNVRRTFEAS